MRRSSGGKGTGAAHKTIRASIPHLTRDRVLYNDIQKALKLVLDGTILRNVVKVWELGVATVVRRYGQTGKNACPTTD